MEIIVGIILLWIVLSVWGGKKEEPSDTNLMKYCYDPRAKDVYSPNIWSSTDEYGNYTNDTDTFR